MSDNTENTPDQDAGDDLHETPGKKPVSTKKVEANRKNAKKSTGPRTEAGKAKAASNSYRHGFYAKNLFLTPEQAAKDKADYLTLADGLYDHYRPVGYLENLLVERIATQALRSTRLLAHEQRVFAWVAPLETRSISNLVRYETSINCGFARAIKELERLQEIRKAEATPSGSSDSNEDGSLDPEPPTVEPSAPDGEPPADPCTRSAAAPTESDAERLEVAHSTPATLESCGTNPTASETNGPAATMVQDNDGDGSQDPEPNAESQTPVTGKNSETNPRKSVADQETEVLDYDYF